MVNIINLIFGKSDSQNSNTNNVNFTLKYTTRLHTKTKFKKYFVQEIPTFIFMIRIVIKYFVNQIIFDKTYY